jgi:hypothetical protein
MDKIIDNLHELYAKLETLKEVKVDPVNWVAYYLDETTNEKWLKEYPHSEYHGGGVPQLRLIEKFPWE